MTEEKKKKKKTLYGSSPSLTVRASFSHVSLEWSVWTQSLWTHSQTQLESESIPESDTDRSDYITLQLRAKNMMRVKINI